MPHTPNIPAIRTPASAIGAEGFEYPGYEGFPVFDFPEYEGFAEYEGFPEYGGYPTFRPGRFSKPAFEEPEFEPGGFKVPAIGSLLGQARQEQAVTGKALSPTLIQGLAKSTLAVGAEQAEKFQLLEDARKRQERARAFGEYQFETDLAFKQFAQRQNLDFQQHALGAGLSLKTYQFEKGLSFEEYQFDKGLHFEEYTLEKGLAFQEYTTDKELDFEGYVFEKGLAFDTWKWEQEVALEQKRISAEEGKCCMILLILGGTLAANNMETSIGAVGALAVVRQYRDEQMTNKSRRGYYKLSDKIVPLMRKSKLLKWLVKTSMVVPLISYGEYYYNKRGIGVIFKPVTKFWLKVYSLFGGNKPYTRKNGEVVT